MSKTIIKSLNVYLYTCTPLEIRCLKPDHLKLKRSIQVTPPLKRFGLLKDINDNETVNVSVIYTSLLFKTKAWLGEWWHISSSRLLSNHKGSAKIYNITWCFHQYFSNIYLRPLLISSWWQDCTYRTSLWVSVSACG